MLAPVLDGMILKIIWNKEETNEKGAVFKHTDYGGGRKRRAGGDTNLKSPSSAIM